MLDPSRGRTKTGQLWAYARDDRPWEGSDPPGVAYARTQSRGLRTPLTDHPWSIHHYFCHGALPTDEYDRVSDAADVEWENGVKSGRHPDDIIDARDEFVAARIVSEVPPPEDCVVLAEQELAMLQSLEIQHERMLMYGLVSKTIDRPRSCTD